MPVLATFGPYPRSVPSSTMMGTMRTLISNGTVVTGSIAAEADVVIDGEKIVGVVAPGSAEGDFGRVIDATGRYVIPGGVDMHTHMELPVSGTSSSDTYETGTRAAAIGGTTTIVDYAGQTRGDTVSYTHLRAHETVLDLV